MGAEFSFIKYGKIAFRHSVYPVSMSILYSYPLHE